MTNCTSHVLVASAIGHRRFVPHSKAIQIIELDMFYDCIEFGLAAAVFPHCISWKMEKNMKITGDQLLKSYVSFYFIN